jgi:uncharacterized protein (TIGR00290 family)
MKTILFWSGGKDSAAALAELPRLGHEVELLLTTYSLLSGRIPMQEIPIELAEIQAQRLGLPLLTLPLPLPCPNADYLRIIGEALAVPGLAGHALAFGDIHLEDIQRFREQQFVESNRTLLFPLWGSPPAELARRISAEQQAVITCVDRQRLSLEFLGRNYDAALLADLPREIDPCGEQGEFHTFVHGSPLFSAPIDFELGEMESDGRFAWRAPRLKEAT